MKREKEGEIDFEYLSRVMIFFVLDMYLIVHKLFFLCVSDVAQYRPVTEFWPSMTSGPRG